jgi:hypothetical protein
MGLTIGTRLFLLIASTMTTTPVVLVGGQGLWTETLFRTYYGPQLESWLAQHAPDAQFIMGGANGADLLAQHFLLEHGCAPERITVYDIKDEDHRVHPLSKLVNGFVKCKPRDQAMLAACTDTVIVLHQYSGGGSGSAANLICHHLRTTAPWSASFASVEAAHTLATLITTLIRGNSTPLDVDELAKLGLNKPN